MAHRPHKAHESRPHALLCKGPMFPRLPLSKFQYGQRPIPVIMGYLPHPRQTLPSERHKGPSAITGGCQRPFPQNLWLLAGHPWLGLHSMCPQQHLSRRCQHLIQWRRLLNHTCDMLHRLPIPISLLVHLMLGLTHCSNDLIGTKIPSVGQHRHRE